MRNTHRNKNRRITLYNNLGTVYSIRMMLESGGKVAFNGVRVQENKKSCL